MKAQFDLRGLVVFLIIVFSFIFLMFFTSCPKEDEEKNSRKSPYWLMTVALFATQSITGITAVNEFYFCLNTCISVYNYRPIQTRMK